MVLLWFALTSGHAQLPKRIAKGFKNDFLSARYKIDTYKLSSLLETRKNQSYLRAIDERIRQNVQHMPAPFLRDIEKPSLDFMTPLALNRYIYELYPHLQGILETPKQISSYFIAQNNRLLTRDMVLQKQSFFQKNQAIQQLKRRQVLSTQENMQFVLSLIPDDIQYILIGEAHGYLLIEYEIADLINKIGEKFTKRPIFLFTEFIQQGKTPSSVRSIVNALSPINGPNSKQHLPVFKAALKHNISIVGLEPQFVSHIANEMPDGRSIWETRQGMALRNKFWEQTLESYRTQFPNALFIVYGGNAHLDYTEPNSIGKTVRKNNQIAFSASFYPGLSPDDPFAREYLEKIYSSYLTTYNIKQSNWLRHYNPGKKGFLPISAFDFATEGSFPQRILLFGNQDYKITGFDIQIKTPEPI